MIKFIVCMLILALSPTSFACLSDFDCRGFGESCHKSEGAGPFDHGQCLNSGGREVQQTKTCFKDTDCYRDYECTGEFGQKGICVKAKK